MNTVWILFCRQYKYGYPDKVFVELWWRRPTYENLQQYGYTQDHINSLHKPKKINGMEYWVECFSTPGMEPIVEYIQLSPFEKYKVTNLRSSKELRLLGFSEPTDWYWQIQDLPFSKPGLKRIKTGEKKINHNAYDEYILSAPTDKQVKKWLKKQYK